MGKKRRHLKSKNEGLPSIETEQLASAVEEVDIEDKEDSEAQAAAQELIVVGGPDTEPKPPSDSRPDTEPKPPSASRADTTPKEVALTLPQGRISRAKEPQSIEKKTELMRRPNLGKLGRPIQLYANFYPTKVQENKEVYHYDVTVFRKKTESKSGKGDMRRKPAGLQPGEQPAPEGYMHVVRMPRFLAVLIVQALYETYKRVFTKKYGLVFDGQKNLITTFMLVGISSDKKESNGGCEFDVSIRNPEKSIDEQFRLRIKYAATIRVNLKEVFSRDLQARKSLATLVYDLLLKQAYFFNLTDYITENRRIFYYPDPIYKFPLGDGVYRFPGFWQSLRPVQGWKVMLNIDQANTSFVKDGKLTDILKTEFRVRPEDVNGTNIRQVSAKLEKLVKGIKITQLQRLIHRTAKCNGITRTSAADTTFPVDAPNGQKTMMSVATYFQNQFRAGQFVKQLQYPNLPCLKLGNRSFIPLEFCEIKAGQRYPRKLNATQTAAMLQVASQPADQRKRLIEEDMKYLKINEDPYLKEFGVTVSTEMVNFTGRVLPAAQVLFANNNRLMPDKGGWNMRNARVIDGRPIRKFAVLCTSRSCRQDEIANFICEWRKSAIQMGIAVRSVEASMVVQELNENNMETRLSELRQRVGADLDLVFVILDGQNTPFYANVKKAGDVTLGISTQCVQYKNVRNAKPATMANINLKINGKLGGVNCKLTSEAQNTKGLMNEPILYLGADVNHSSPDDSEEPVSCAAIVGNVDLNPSVFCARIFLQSQIRTERGSVVGSRNQEYIGQLTDGVQMAIELFLARNRVLPHRIIMFRDGVGETMFQMVLERELIQIQEACQKVEQRYPDVVKKSGFKPSYRPPITFIVVQKRHHTRLFCVNRQDAMERNGFNVPPGTTVDTTIVHPEEFDFYLCSHLGLQGTSKPAHYHVLSDDNKFSADELQRLIYHLCHTYCRSTRTVSIPPPCYYADLVAYRARQYLKTLQRGDAETVSSGDPAPIALAQLQGLVNVNDVIIKKGMYFV